MNLKDSIRYFQDRFLLCIKEAHAFPHKFVIFVDFFPFFFFLPFNWIAPCSTFTIQWFFLCHTSVDLCSCINMSHSCFWIPCYFLGQYLQYINVILNSNAVLQCTCCPFQFGFLENLISAHSIIQIANETTEQHWVTTNPWTIPFNKSSYFDSGIRKYIFLL